MEWNINCWVISITVRKLNYQNRRIQKENKNKVRSQLMPVYVQPTSKFKRSNSEQCFLVASLIFLIGSCAVWLFFVLLPLLQNMLIGLLLTYQEISSLSVEPCEGEELIVTVFEITKSEVHRIILSYLINILVPLLCIPLFPFSIINGNQPITSSLSIWVQVPYFVERELEFRFLAVSWELLLWFFLFLLLMFIS